MQELIVSYVVIAIAFSLLRILRTLAWEQTIPAGTTWLFALVAYVALVAVCGVVFVVGSSAYEVIDEGGLWDWFGFLMLMLGFTALTYFAEKYFEFVDLSGMFPFWLACLRFEDPAIRRENVFEAVEREEIRAIHKEQTGKDLPVDRRKPVKHTDPNDALASLEKLKGKAIERAELKEELESLTAGESVDVTDVLRVNSFRDGTSDRYEHVRKLFVDPEDRQLRFQLLFPTVKHEDLQSVDKRFQILQHIYDLFQALQEEPWLADFDLHIDEFHVECYRVTIDSFDMPTESAFLRVRMPLSELRAHAGHVYVVTEFERLGRANWI